MPVVVIPFQRRVLFFGQMLTSKARRSNSFAGALTCLAMADTNEHGWPGWLDRAAPLSAQASTLHTTSYEAPSEFDLSGPLRQPSRRVVDHMPDGSLKPPARERGTAHPSRSPRRPYAGEGTSFITSELPPTSEPQGLAHQLRPEESAARESSEMTLAQTGRPSRRWAIERPEETPGAHPAIVRLAFTSVQTEKARCGSRHSDVLTEGAGQDTRRGDDSHESDRGDGPGRGNGRDDAGGAARAAGSDKRRHRSDSCVGIRPD